MEELRFDKAVQELVPEKCRQCYDLARMVVVCTRFPSLSTPSQLLEDVEKECSGYAGPDSTPLAAYPELTDEGYVVVTIGGRTSKKKDCPYFREDMDA